MALAKAARDDWFVATHPHPEASVIAAAFPHAGAGCSAFARHARMLPPWLELMTLNLPGRQARFREPFRTEIDMLSAELAEYWAQRTGPFLFFGYCSGALLAYCVARCLQERGAVIPKRLVVGSFKAPHLASGESLADLDSETFWKALIENRAIPSQLSANIELRVLTEPVMRADMALTAGYRHVSGPPLKVPITVLAGAQDKLVPPEDAMAWAQHTTQGFHVRHLSAGHWFMEEDPAGSIAVLVREAEAVRGLAP
jgi:surfactin synthase thioesterase subunit